MSQNQYKVLIVAPTAYPLGGVAVWLDYLLSGLNKRGVDIVFGALDGQFHNADVYLKEYPYASTIKIQNPSGTSYGRVKAIKEAVRKCAPDILVSVNIPDVYSAARELKKSTHPQLKVVSTLHGLVDNLFNDIEHYSDCIDYVVVTNKLTQLMLEQLTSFNKDRIYYAPYGVIEHKESEGKPSQKTLRLLYCGRIDNTQKRCVDLTKIVAEMENRGLDYQLSIAGAGPYKEQLFRDLALVSSPNHVCDLGVFSAHELAEKVYAKSDVLILTSDWETGPIVIWEAMACGVSVVTSRYNGLDVEGALFDNENCLIFDIGDIQGAVDKLVNVTQPDVFSELTKNGRQLISTRYSREASLQIWQQTFNHIAGAKNVKNTKLRSNHYPKNGAIEKLFGNRASIFIRRLINLPALVNDAGSEWPHRHSEASLEYKSKFIETLTQLKERVRDEA